MELIKRESDGELDYTVSWVNDWSSHLNPLLKSRTFDAGFPWERPDCDEPEELDPQLQDRCQKFFFSDALYETFEVFYIRNNSTFKFESDNDVIGKSICLTIDNGLDDLDGEGRNWAKDGKITLIRPASLEECFRLLDQKAVDAVVTPDITGRAIANTLGMADKVKALPRPLNIETLHVIVSKTHPQARTLLYYVNTALAKLKENGDYDHMVEKHLSHYWETYGPHKSAAGSQAVRNAKPGSSAEPEQRKSTMPQGGTSEPATSHARK
jgi:polar amino acid transport system substrate-binding protein